MSDSPNAKPETVTTDDARRAEPRVPAPDALSLQELKNSHDLNTHHAERGVLGRLIGSRGEKPGNIAFLVICACFFLIIFTYWWLPPSTNFESFWKISSAIFSIITLALGYIFGSGSKG